MPHADDDADREHGQERERVAGDGEVEFKVGVGEGVIDAEHGDDRRDEAKDIAVGEAGGQQHGEHKDHRHGLIAVADEDHAGADDRSAAQQPRGDERIADELPPALVAGDEHVAQPDERRTQLPVLHGVSPPSVYTI